ncbi:hypothetical protein [Thiocapsa roseopersicina]|uniref:Uncharacterized protein n=1 Tax=Thiocapsa roseopersicina TaxID=1058 RepID=A0A1H2QRX7_THIRO|nr:hypothetical protein [Thiocapsa roseopersicina]SDW09953.1 hypothetical protein SAMN05421783_101401 [Thiocapsa roseopersicina]
MLSTKGQVIERLLDGDFICRTTNEDGWRFLRIPANREQVDAYLGQLNRLVATIGTGPDSEVFFCGYRALGDAERKKISEQFRDICQALTPLVEWLVLVQDAAGQDAPLTEGMPIRLNELQTVIEDTPAFREQLSHLCSHRLFYSTSVDVDRQIKQVFSRLCDLRYLIRPNTEKQIYLATGKLDYLYEVIRFIDDAEGLNLEDQAESAVQGQLL